MKKKILSQILLIFLIMIIGIFSSIRTVNAASKASLSASSNVKVGGKFTVTLNLPSEACDANCDITVKYSDGTTASDKITYVKGFEGYDSKSVSFSAKVVGDTTVTATNIYLNDSNGKVLEDGGSTSITLKIEEEKKPDPPTPSNPNDNNNNNNDNNNNNNSNTNNTQKPEEVKFTDVNESVFTNDRVNLRKSYSTSSAKITTLDKNTKLTRTGVSSNGWSRVTYNGQTGYIYSQYLTKDETPEEKPDEKDVKITDANETVYAKQNCNLRKSWTTKSDKVGYLKKGQEITRTGVTDNGWSRVKYEGKDVFVLSTLITKEKPEEDEEEPEEEPVTEEPEEVEKTELQILQEEIGVLPEVGNNVAKVLYIGVTTISLAVALGGLYYINKKDVK